MFAAALIFTSDVGIALLKLADFAMLFEQRLNPLRTPQCHPSIAGQCEGRDHITALTQARGRENSHDPL